MPLTIPASAFPAVFPFHMVLDSGLRVTHFGPALKRMCPAIEAITTAARPLTPLASIS